MKKEKYPKCPICNWKTGQYTMPSRRGAETNHHLISKAKNELWAKEFNKNLKTPHLDWFRKHKSKKIEVKYSVNFDF